MAVKGNNTFRIFTLVNLSSDMPDNTSFALFSTTNTANFTNGTLLDAVGFTGAPALYFEATPLVPVGANPVEHSFLRRLTTGLPQDLGNNAADFVFITTDGSINGGIQSILGAPGPENLASHIQRNSTIKNMLLDPAADSASSPNRARGHANRKRQLRHALFPSPH